MEVDIKCCVVRDPIKRFISTYSNRILFHKDKAFYNFSVDEVIENLEGLNFFNKHFLPQSYPLELLAPLFSGGMHSVVEMKLPVLHLPDAFPLLLLLQLDVAPGPFDLAAEGANGLVNYLMFTRSIPFPSCFFKLLKYLRP